jgi:hypothetical protein
MATPTDPKARIIADPPHFVPRRMGSALAAIAGFVSPRATQRG